MNMNEIVALPFSFDVKFDLISRHRNVCVDIYRGASATHACFTSGKAMQRAVPIRACYYDANRKLILLTRRSIYANDPGLGVPIVVFQAGSRII